MNRNYRVEFDTHTWAVPSHMSAKNTTSRADFLPGPKDFEGPTDHDGSKGMTEWKSTHQRKDYKELI